MKGKRIVNTFITVVVLSILLSILGGCGNNSADNAAVSGDSTQAVNTENTVEPVKDTTLRLLVCWQGLSFLKPSDEVNNAVAKEIKAKTGVTLEVEWINTSETEKLNQMFATASDMPDMVMAPFWGGSDTATLAIKKAAKDGLLMELDELIDKYGPNLQDAFKTGLATDFVEMDLLDKDYFGGKKYVLPMHTPATKDETTFWGYTVFGRKDILNELNVDPSSIRSSEDIYELAKKIKTGNFKDTQGNAVIPASCWQNGWSYETFLNSFKTRGFSSFIKEADGSYSYNVFSPNLDKEVLFMREMVSEGLFDVEAFRQDDNTAKQKHVTGRVALTSAHYPHIKANLTDTLYKEHPEMQYVPLGPIADVTGQALMPETKQLEGLSGCAGMFLTKDCRDPEAAIKYLNYINGDEGKYLAYLGVKGVHWDMVDGKPRMSDEWFEKNEADPSYSINEGIGSLFTFGVSRLPNTLFDNARAKEGTVTDPVLDTIKKMYPLQFFSGYRITNFDSAYPNIENIRNLFKANDYKSVIEQAYFAKSEKEALSVLEKYREVLKQGGIDDYVKYINEQAKTRNDILN